jgi:hypothetical protein
MRVRQASVRCTEEALPTAANVLIVHDASAKRGCAGAPKEEAKVENGRLVAAR